MNRIYRQQDIIKNVDTKRDITIIHLSDIHFNLHTKLRKLDKIREEIYKNNPDYVVITGDLLDEPSITKNKQKIKELLMFLTDISNFTKLLISIGNHDVWNNSDFKFFNNLNQINNIYVLNNQSYQDDYIYIAGFTLPQHYYYNITREESMDTFLEAISEQKEMLNKLPLGIPKVALIHSPVLVTKKESLNLLKEYDVVLSGHTHNGMVPRFLEKVFPKNKGIISPSKHLFPEVARGKMERNVYNHKITLIISGGVTKLSSRSTRILDKLNFVYDISINKIIIEKRRLR